MAPTVCLEPSPTPHRRTEEPDHGCQASQAAFFQTEHHPFSAHHARHCASRFHVHYELIESPRWPRDGREVIVPNVQMRNEGQKSVTCSQPGAWMGPPRVSDTHPPLRGRLLGSHTLLSLGRDEKQVRGAPGAAWASDTQHPAQLRLWNWGQAWGVAVTVS